MNPDSVLYRDLFFQIFKYLDIQDLIRLSETSKKYNALVKEYSDNLMDSFGSERCSDIYFKYRICVISQKLELKDIIEIITLFVENIDTTGMSEKVMIKKILIQVVETPELYDQLNFYKKEMLNRIWYCVSGTVLIHRNFLETWICLVFRNFYKVILLFRNHRVFWKFHAIIFYEYDKLYTTTEGLDAEFEKDKELLQDYILMIPDSELLDFFSKIHYLYSLDFSISDELKSYISDFLDLELIFESRDLSDSIRNKIQNIKKEFLSFD